MSNDESKGGHPVPPIDKKPHEAVRNAVALFTSMLNELTPEQRVEVFIALGGTPAEAAEWKAHNEQRLEEVYAARALLQAEPHETLPMAITRLRGVAQAAYDALADLRVAHRPTEPMEAYVPELRALGAALAHTS